MKLLTTLPIIATLFLVLNGSLLAEDSASIAMPVISSLAKKCSSLIDLKYRYTFESKGRVRLYEFCKSGKSFYVKLLKDGNEPSDGAPLSMVSYDGLSYYVLYRDKSLAIASDFKHFANQISGHFITNPVYNPLHPYFFDAPEGYFSVPLIELESTWIKSLVKAGTRVVKGDGVFIDSPNVSVRCFDGSNGLPRITGRLAKYKMDWQVSKVTEPIVLGVEESRIPAEIECKYTSEDGSVAMDSYKISLDLKSLTVLTSPPALDSFRVPSVIATSIYDCDLGARVKAPQSR